MLPVTEFNMIPYRFNCTNPQVQVRSVTQDILVLIGYLLLIYENTEL